MIWPKLAGDHFHPVVNFILWVGCEIAIAACDLAEVIGSAIALNLLFGLPLVWGVCLTACDVLAVLYLQNKGFRLIEALVITLIGIIAVSFGIQIFLSKPDFGAMALGCLPSPEILHNTAMFYVCDRDSRSDGYAAQSLSALFDCCRRAIRTDAEREKRSHPFRHNRLELWRSFSRFHQCRDTRCCRCNLL